MSVVFIVVPIVDQKYSLIPAAPSGIFPHPVQVSLDDIKAEHEQALENLDKLFRAGYEIKATIPLQTSLRTDNTNTLCMGLILHRP